jgi:hypothetical protein
MPPRITTGANSAQPASRVDVRMFFQRIDAVSGIIRTRA